MANDFTKKKAIPAIINSAKIYNRELKNKELLILSLENKHVIAYNIKFSESNFMHFTGTKSTTLKPAQFFHLALNGKLSERDFEFKDSPFLTQKKCQVLENAVTLPYSAKMIGHYTGEKIKLRADIGAGTVNYVMTCGFIDKDNHILHPIGVLNEDIRNITTRTPIIAILRKNKNEKLYSEITYKSKNINLDKLHIPKKIRTSISEKTLSILQPQHISINKQQAEVAAATEFKTRIVQAKKQAEKANNDRHKHSATIGVSQKNITDRNLT